MSQAWLNGEFLDESQANISIRDTGLLHAAGVFTTQASSPARKAATQALPPGFVVIDDFTEQQVRTSTALGDVGAFITP